MPVICSHGSTSVQNGPPGSVNGVKRVVVFLEGRDGCLVSLSHSIRSVRTNIELLASTEHDIQEGTLNLVVLRVISLTASMQALAVLAGIDECLVARLGEPVLVQHIHFELQIDSAHRIVNLGQSLQAGKVFLVFDHLRCDRLIRKDVWVQRAGCVVVLL